MQLQEFVIKDGKRCPGVGELVKRLARGEVPPKPKPVKTRNPRSPGMLTALFVLNTVLSAISTSIGLDPMVIVNGWLIYFGYAALLYAGKKR